MSVTDEELQAARELVESKREALAAARAEREARESGVVNDGAYDALMAEADALEADLAREAEASEKWNTNQGQPSLAPEPNDLAPEAVDTNPPPVVVPDTPPAVVEAPVVDTDTADAGAAGNGKTKTK